MFNAYFIGMCFRTLPLNQVHHHDIINFGYTNEKSGFFLVQELGGVSKQISQVWTLVHPSNKRCWFGIETILDNLQWNTILISPEVTLPDLSNSLSILACMTANTLSVFWACTSIESRAFWVWASSSCLLAHLKHSWLSVCIWMRGSPPSTATQSNVTIVQWSCARVLVIFSPIW